MSLNKKFFIGGAAAIEPTEYFSVKLYDGNGSSQSIDVGFAADFAYIKNRTVGQGWSVWDTVRGASSGYLQTQLTSAEANAQNMLTFDSDGFDVSTNGGGYTQTNRSSSSDKYVAYSWKAAGSSSTFNVIENGSLSTGTTASSVGISETGANATLTGASINRDSGFGIITNTITTSGYPQVLSHGFGSEPDLIITKPTNTNEGWLVKVNESVFGSTYDKQLVLNTNAAATDVTNSSRQITSIHTNATYTPNPQSFVSYIFKSVEGFSKIGSYTGNASSKSVTTGFQPRFVMLKRTNAIGNWNIWDAIRNPSADDANNNILYANYNNAETDAGSGRYISFNSNGFTISGDSGDQNANGSTYIYLAIA